MLPSILQAVTADPITALTNLVSNHPLISLGVWTVFQWVFSAYASSLRAPTKDCSQSYLSWFAIVNTVAGNLSRINPPKVENSPNFEAAVTKRINGG